MDIRCQKLDKQNSGGVFTVGGRQTVAENFGTRSDLRPSAMMMEISKQWPLKLQMQNILGANTSPPWPWSYHHSVIHTAPTHSYVPTAVAGSDNAARDSLRWFVCAEIINERVCVVVPRLTHWWWWRPSNGRAIPRRLRSATSHYKH